ncbi:hypothetical protein HDU99_001379, partial [Rhizoclosmatium hyalinum]
MQSEFLTARSEEITENDTAANLKQVELTRFQFLLLFGALFLAVFLGSLDVAIGGPALDIIAAELGEQVLLPWFGAAYTISEGVIPI